MPDPTTPEELEKNTQKKHSGLTLKTHQVFSVHNTPFS